MTLGSSQPPLPHLCPSESSAHSGSISGTQVQEVGQSQSAPHADLGPLGVSLVSPSVCLTKWGRHVTMLVEG